MILAWEHFNLRITNPELSNKPTITSTIDNSRVPHTSKTTISNANTNETVDDLTEALIMEIMRDDDSDMGTDLRQIDIIDNYQNSHIEPQTNHLTQESSDSTGLEGVTQKTPEIIQFPSTNPINLHANQTREIINNIPNNLLIKTLGPLMTTNLTSKGLTFFRISLSSTKR